MEFLRPTSVGQALELKARWPEAVPICGGTDVMVELNFDRRRPTALLDLAGLADLRRWERRGDTVTIGAGLPYEKLISEIGTLAPGLARASLTVGSPQIRNRGTLGGNLGAASPAGDTHPALLAAFAEVEVASVRGSRRIPIDEFYLGVKKNALEPDELITAVHLPVATGGQEFSKVGTRNAMVIAVCSFAVALWPDRCTVGTGIGSAGPTPRRSTAAEAWVAAELDWDNPTRLAPELTAEFGRLVVEAASPIDDVRGSAAYRRHSLAVVAQRSLGWVWRDYVRTMEKAV